MQNNKNIPVDWQMKFLGDIGTFSKGAGITKNDLVDIGKPCVRYAELYTKFEFVIPKCISFIPEDIAKKSKQIQKGCILFAGSGETKEEIGKCAVYDNDEIAYAGGDNIIYTIKDNYPVYLSYYLNTLGRRQLNKLGQGDSIVHIHAEDLKKVKIPLPPLPEQEKIAEILSCWDEAIEKVSSLISLKEKQKKGLMQRLLTGKTRLPGFTQPWKEVKLGDVCNFINGYMFKSETYVDNGKYKIITIANVQQGFLDYNTTNSINELPKDLQSNQILSIGDIVFSMTGNVGRVCRVSTVDCLLNQRVGKIVEKNISKDFLYQLLLTDRFIRKMEAFAQGGAQDNLSLKDVKKYKITIPSDIAEQKAIADILSTADEEIEKLKSKLDLLKLQKKGLMQQLLTGKIRVKIKNDKY